MRLFIALEVPGPARAAIVRWRDSVLGGHEQLRPVAEDALHATLVFLGWRPQEAVPGIWELAATAAGALPAPTLTPARLVPVPPRRPRLVALDLDDEDASAAAVHGAVAEALAAADLHEPEARPFWPHVTLARVRGRGRIGRIDPGTPPPQRPFSVRTVTLYRSHLHPSGARYEALERLELGGGGAG